ncbi:YkyA family protein [Mesobacillus zeae]|uniref:YkyA family protein n=1 Tax=Mesobacillus zeae TaxID=1917180 RepID=A0A398BD88_9BACI|nr:YkyA family protein [Mesobacillus zeae]RID87842.1 hypothetical protein D1970_03110 [Mesobacillus zeae]
MFIHKKLLMTIMLIAVPALLLSGCIGGQEPAEKVFTQLEQVAEIEKSFEELQDPLVRLEKEEKKIYGRIISTSAKNNEEIIRLTDNALEVAEKREGFIGKEHEIIKKSKKQFGDFEDSIGDLENQELKAEAQKLSERMNERYTSHDELYRSYLEGLKHDRKLYNQLKAKDPQIAKLEEQVNKINAAYKEVFEANERFNAATEKYNKEKLDFYQQAGLEVKQK